MEIAPMMMQTQDVAAIVPGMTAAGSAALPSRLPVAPLLFAALLKDMQLPEQAGADPKGFPVNLTVAGKEPLPGKGKTAFNSLSGKPVATQATKEQTGDLSAAALAQLLAMAGQASPKSFMPAIPQESGETCQENKDSFRSSGDEVGMPETPLPVMVAGSMQGPAVEGLVMPSANVISQREVKGASIHTKLKDGQSQPGDDQVTWSPEGKEKPSRGKTSQVTGVLQSEAVQSAKQVRSPGIAAPTPSQEQPVQPVPVGTELPSKATTIVGNSSTSGLLQGKVATLYSNNDIAASSGAAALPEMFAVPENGNANGLKPESISLSDKKSSRAGTTSLVIEGAPENKTATGRQAGRPAMTFESTPQVATVAPEKLTIADNKTATGRQTGRPAMAFESTPQVATVTPEMLNVVENKTATGRQAGRPAMTFESTPQVATVTPEMLTVAENKTATGQQSGRPAMTFESTPQVSTVTPEIRTVPENKTASAMQETSPSIPRKNGDQTGTLPSTPAAVTGSDIDTGLSPGTQEASYIKDVQVSSVPVEVTSAQENIVATNHSSSISPKSPKKTAPAGVVPLTTTDATESTKTSGPQTQNNTMLHRDLAAVPGRGIKQGLQQSVQAEAPQSFTAGAPAPDLAVDTPEPKVVQGIPEQSNSQVDKAQVAFGGMQVRTKPDTTATSAAQNLTVEPNQGAPTVTPAETTARQSRRLENYAALSGLRPVGREIREEKTQPDADSATVTLDNLQLEVVFAEQAPRAGTSGGNEKDGKGARKDEKERLSGPGVSAERMIEQPIQSRFALAPKVEEQKNVLHENILSQVKASVISHDGKGNGTMTVRLNPVEFGELQINVRIENQQVKVEIITENRTVRDALMGNLDSLKETFQKQNLTMERFDVSSGGGNSSGQGFREDRGEQQRINQVMYGHEAAPFEAAREQIDDDWGSTENSLVNLRL